MELTGELITRIGFLFWMIPFGLFLFGKLYNPIVLWTLFIISLILAIYGLNIFDDRISYYQNHNAASVLFAPITYISLFSMMRLAFKNAYGFEPDVAIHSKYSRFDNRKLNFFDFLIYIVPLAISAGVVALLS